MSFVDFGLLFALGLSNGRFLSAGRQIDLFELATFGSRYHGALFALGGDLLLHGLQDDRGRRQILDLVAKNLHAPVESGFVNGRHHGLVDEIAFLEGLVELHTAHDAAKCGLRKLRDGDDVVARTVACSLRIRHLEKEYAVDS